MSQRRRTLQPQNGLKADFRSFVRLQTSTLEVCYEAASCHSGTCWLQRALGASYKGENNRLLAFLRFVGDLQLKSVTKQHIDSYLPVPGDRIVTSGWFKKYETLSRFIQFAIGRGYMRHRILPDLLPEKPPAFVPYIYSLGDMRNLLGVPDSHYSPLCPLVPYTMRVFLVLLYGTGLRLGETIKLNIQDVDLDTAIITVRDTKFFKSRLVPIGGDLLRILHQYRTRQTPTQLQLPDTPFFRTRLGKAVRHDNADHQFQCFFQSEVSMEIDLGCLHIFVT
jgi:integrase/recombinase XerD